MPDSVVAFRGRYSGRNIFFADKIFLPDVPKFKREKPPLEEKVYAILLSDIHVGSNKFCEKAFERFLEWLNGEVANKREEEFVSRVKYLVIAGDVVDGIAFTPVSTMSSRFRTSLTSTRPSPTCSGTFRPHNDVHRSRKPRRRENSYSSAGLL